MPHALTIPALSALALAGSGLGVYLGHSAVSEINPAYFSSVADDRWHTDLSPNRYATAAAPLPAVGALSAAELDQALGRGCIGCRPTTAEYYPIHTSRDDAYRQSWAAVDAPVTPASFPDEPMSESELAAKAAEEAEHQAALVAVHRYASFESATAAAETPVAQLASAKPAGMESEQQAE